MPRIQQNLELDGVPIVRLESAELQVDVAPSVGGRIVGLLNKPAGYEFLWRNRGLRLQLKPSGSEYDPNFYGGIDELLPNDVAEPINGVDCPDHGELWTTPLACELLENRLVLQGRLARFGLHYERTMQLRGDTPWVDFAYQLTNTTDQPREFLWKLHAALAVREGDVIECPARQARIVDPEWSRFKVTQPFAWPTIEGQCANLVPPKDGTMDFFYLYELTAGEMWWRRPSAGLKFGYQFDTSVFPYAWFFASYGGFLDHYTVILEPCTAMPISVKEASEKRQCSRLEPGETLRSHVSLYAGPI